MGVGPRTGFYFFLTLSCGLVRRKPFVPHCGEGFVWQRGFPPPGLTVVL